MNEFEKVDDLKFESEEHSLEGREDIHAIRNENVISTRITLAVGSEYKTIPNEKLDDVEKSKANKRFKEYKWNVGVLGGTIVLFIVASSYMAIPLYIAAIPWILSFGNLIRIIYREARYIEK